MSVIILIAGLVLLVFAGDALVRGAVEAAERLHIPPIVIGLTIVAFGTSAPELVVSIEAVLEGAPGLAIGNVVGSNIANSLLVLGLPAIIGPIVLSEAGIRRSYAFMAVMTIVIFVALADLQVSRTDGIILLSLLVTYLLYSAFAANGERAKSMEDNGVCSIKEGELSPLKITMLIGFGIIGLGVGGGLTTDGALGVAEMFGLADSAVGLTIVALGTSLPEVAASVSAACRRQTDVIIGNVIGSNIFNILGIVGITSIVAPLGVSQSIVNFDIWVVIAATIVLAPIVFVTRRINRIEGIIMTAAYLIYIVIAIRNGTAMVA